MVTSTIADIPEPGHAKDWPHRALALLVVQDVVGGDNYVMGGQQGGAVVLLPVRAVIQGHRELRGLRLNLILPLIGHAEGADHQGSLGNASIWRLHCG